jgi:hypothetical protein
MQRLGGHPLDNSGFGERQMSKNRSCCRTKRGQDVPHAADCNLGKVKRRKKEFAVVAFHCLTCGIPMTQKSGYADTGMCGPCATGESDTFEEFGVSW